MEARTYTAEEFVIIDRIARIVSSVRGAKTDYTRLAAELEQAVSFDIFGVVLLRHDHEAVRVMVYQRSPQGGWSTDHHQRPYRDSMLERMSQAPAPIVHNYPAGLDGSPVESGDALSGYHHLHSALIVPLMVENHVLGTLELGSVALNVYIDTTLQRLVTTVARLLATAIEGVQLGGNAAIQDRQRKVLQDVTSALTTRIDLSAVLQRIVSGLADALNASACIVLLDRSRKQLRMVAHSGLDADSLDRVFHSGILVNDKGILGQTLLSRQTCASNDISVDERFPESHPLCNELGLRSVLSVPLRTETATHGVFFLGSPDTGGFTPLKSDIFALFANQATIAIHNSSLLDAMEKRNRFYQTVEHLEQALQQHRGSEEHFATDTDLTLLEQVREETQRNFGISFTTLLRFMTEKLPSLSEHMLQRDTSIDQDKDAFSLHDLHDFSPELQADVDVYRPSPEKRIVQEYDTQDEFGSDEEALSLLAQTAETAITRAAILGGLSRLLLQLKQSTTNGVKDAWFIVDLQGHCIYMNPAAETLCDLRSEGMSSVYANQLISTSVVHAQAGEPIEQIFAKLLPRMRNGRAMLSYLQELAQGNSYRQELRCDLAAEPLTNRKDDAREGTENFSGRSDSELRDSHFLFTRYPLSDQQGQLEATALQMQDITEQVRDEKNRSVLLSAVTHDLRTPLTTIKAAVTGLMQTEFAWSEEERQEILVDIDSETDHLTVLVNDLVELSRIEMGALTVEKTWCDVTEIVHGAISAVEKADKRILMGRAVNVRVHPQISLIWCDHVQLQRVFFHLLKNAAHRSPALTPIDVVLGIAEDGKENLLVRVIDCGADIPESERAHIFQTFNSLRSYGNGMGLAICKGLIAALQGRIWVETIENAHICFSFMLPTHPHLYIATQRSGIGSVGAGTTLKEIEAYSTYNEADREF